MANRTGTTTVDLNLRAGPGTEFRVLLVLPPRTPLEIEAEQGDWFKVSALDHAGWVNRGFVRLDTQGVPAGLLSTRVDGAGAPKALDAVPLAAPEPQRIRLGPNATGTDRLAANTWNKYGGLLAALAAELHIDPGVAVAVLAIESGGRGFAADGRMIIRFENHLFYRQWGLDNAEVFRRHFSFNPEKNWLEHRWRPFTNQPFRDFHGSQDGEWQVFSFARSLDDTAAKLSISMGGPQIVGFNYATLGYESVHQMFDAFTADERNQVIGFFDFVQGPSSDSRRVLALQAGDFTTFASMYNGPGQAAKYGSLMLGLFDTYKRLKPA
ncbi:MAG: DUF3380 domain-containing protein [Anaerolineales bacterium]|nr:DUF3380 domain-containing protein [Anaerolineales bacterium]